MDNIDGHTIFFRIKIHFHATMPLQPRFPYYRDDGDLVWIGFKYESLFSFYVHCGIINHTIRACFQNPPHPQQHALTDKLQGYPSIAPTVEMGADVAMQNGHMMHRRNPNLQGQGQTMGDGSWVGQKVAVDAVGQRRGAEEVW